MKRRFKQTFEGDYTIDILEQAREHFTNGNFTALEKYFEDNGQNDIFTLAKEHFKNGEFTACIKLISSNNLMNKANPDYQAARLVIKAYFAMLHQDPDTVIGKELEVAIKLAPEDYFLILDRNFDNYQNAAITKIMEYGAKECKEKAIVEAALGRMKITQSISGRNIDIFALYKSNGLTCPLELSYLSTFNTIKRAIDNSAFKFMSTIVSGILNTNDLETQKIFNLLSHAVKYAVQNNKIEAAAEMILKFLQHKKFRNGDFDFGPMMRQLLCKAFKNKSDAQYILQPLLAISVENLTSFNVFEEIVKSADVKNLAPIYKKHLNTIIEQLHSGSLASKITTLLTNKKGNEALYEFRCFTIALRLFATDFATINQAVGTTLFSILNTTAKDYPNFTLLCLKEMVMWDLVQEHKLMRNILDNLSGFESNAVYILLKTLSFKGLPLPSRYTNFLYNMGLKGSPDTSFEEVSIRLNYMKVIPNNPNILFIPNVNVFLKAVSICIQEKQFKKAVELLSIIENDIQTKGSLLGTATFKDYLKCFLLAKTMVTMCLSHNEYNSINYDDTLIPFLKYQAVVSRDFLEEFNNFKEIVADFSWTVRLHQRFNTAKHLFNVTAQNSSLTLWHDQNTQYNRKEFVTQISASLKSIYTTLLRMQEKRPHPEYLDELGGIYSSFGYYFFDHYTAKDPDLATEIGFNVTAHANKIARINNFSPRHDITVNFLYKISGGNLLSHRMVHCGDGRTLLTEFTKTSFVRTYFLLQEANLDFKLRSFNKIITTFAHSSFFKQQRNGKDVYVYHPDVASHHSPLNIDCTNYSTIIMPSYLSQHHWNGTVLSLSMVDIAKLINDMKKPCNFLPEQIVLAKGAKQGNEVTLKREQYYYAITNLHAMLSSVSVLDISFKYSPQKEILSAINILLLYKNITTIKLCFPNLTNGNTRIIFEKIKCQINDYNNINHLHSLNCIISSGESEELIEDKAISKERQKGLFGHMLTSYENNAPFFPHRLIASYKDFLHVNFKLSKICRLTSYGAGQEGIGDDIRLWKSTQLIHAVSKTLRSALFIEYKWCLPIELYPLIAQYFTEPESIECVSKWAKAFIENPEKTKMYMEQYKRINNGQFQLEIAL